MYCTDSYFTTSRRLLLYSTFG